MALTKIKKRTGEVVEFDKEKITNAIFKAAASLGGEDRAESERVADRVVELLTQRYTGEEMPSVEEVQDTVEKALIETGHAATAKVYILYRHRKNVEREMKKAMGVDDDLKLPLNSIQVLERRYLMKDDKGKIIETPSQLFKRVATHLASNEKAYGADDATVDHYTDAFFQIMTNFEFMPNSPTLMNAGMELGQLAACFVLPVPDDIEGIFESVKHQAIIHKTGGGCIRKGSRVFSTFCGSERIEKLYDYFEADSTPFEENGSYFVSVEDEDLRVPSFDKDSGQMIFKPVSRIWKYLLPSEKTFRIKAEGNYRAETSEWHPFFVFTEGEVIEKRADELRVGDMLVCSNPSLKENWAYDRNWDIGGIELDEGMAWLTGIFSTDGSLDKTKQGLRLRIFSSDQEIIDKALDIIEKKTGKRYKVDTDRRSKSPVMRITVYDKSLCDAMKRLNRDLVGSKERTVRIPAEVFKSPISIMGAYLAGAIDGDGHIQKSKQQLEISGASIDFAEDLSSLFYLFGITSRYRRRLDPRNPTWVDMHEVSVSGQHELKRVAELVTPYLALTRKKERLVSHISGAHSSSPARIPFSIIEPFLREAGVETANTGIWRKKVKVGNSAFFLARWKEKDKINVIKVISLIDELLSIPISEGSKSKLAMLRNVIPNLLEIRSVERNAEGESLEFYDFTVADTNNYLAGNMGLSVIHNTGFCFSYLRPKGDYVKSTAGVASGPLSFMSAFDNATAVIKQGGKRRGANMATMHAWHPDIEEFVTMKQTPGIMENFNVSVMLDDAFMKAVEGNEDYNLLNPRGMEPVRTVNARSIFKLIAYSAWKCAEPGVLFIDTINRANPTPQDPIHATNPCGEVPMPDYESCNLGSVNLEKFAELDWSKTDWKRKVDWDRMRYVVRLAVQFLDNVIDMNKYPIPQIRDQTMKSRRMGLGVMGFARMLYRMGIAYDSDLGYEVGEHVMKFINDEARKMSHELGRVRGSFPGFKDSTLKDKYDAMRNATVTSIAPTGTISMISDTSSGIEPVFALSFLKTVRAGQYYYMDPVFEHVLKVRGLYSQELIQKVMDEGSIQHMDEIPGDVKAVFRVSHDLSPESHVRMQAAFQKSVELAVSKTINMPANTTVEDVEAIYMMAWKLGCKGLTIYRDSSRQEQVLHVGKSVKTKGVEEDKVVMLNKGP